MTEHRGYQISLVDVERVDPATGEWEPATVHLPVAVGSQRDLERYVIGAVAGYRFTRMTTDMAVKLAMFAATSVVEHELHGIRRRCRLAAVAGLLVIAAVIGAFALL